MNDLVTVRSAKYVSGYILELTFSDGLRSEIDFVRWIEKYPFFAPLRDIEYFKDFKLDGWTVVWENGADVAPESLYEIARQNLQLQTA